MKKSKQNLKKENKNLINHKVNLIKFMINSPLVSIALKIKRDKSLTREIDL